MKDFFSKCDQIRWKQRIWSHLLNKSLTENFIFCAVLSVITSGLIHCLKSVQILSFFWSEYRKIRTRKNSFGHFSRSDTIMVQL